MTAPDPVAVLITAWTEWDEAALAMGERERKSKGRERPSGLTLEREAKAKARAVAALGIDPNAFHRAVAEARRTHIAGHPEGMSVPDAVETALLELGHHPTTPPLKEAS